MRRPTILGYLRIATHPSLFDSPLSYDDAMGNVTSLLHRPHDRDFRKFSGVTLRDPFDERYSAGFD
jgi:hypothetical protein